MKFLPICESDMKERGWEQLDFVYISGDAYVDHPSFGTAIISRVLENEGFKVGIIAQPKWNDINEFKKLGTPRLGFLVSSGNIDSMVNHYSVAKKKRDKDLYSPGGEFGHRPDRAVIVYANKIREVYKDIPIIIGGVEASLRRLSHYDYWDDKVRRSILLDSSADLLIYGMGERQIVEIANALNSGVPINQINYISGTAYKSKVKPEIENALYLPDFDNVKKDKITYAKSFMIQYENTDDVTAKTLIERYAEGYIVQNPPQKPLTQSEFDKVYSLKYARNYHQIYEDMGGIPAITEVKFSLISNRGCFGNCNFCALAFHQGRKVTSRSHNSLVLEAEKFVWEADFKGYIHDVGGPTANFRKPSCAKSEKFGSCKDKQCLFPQACENLDVEHVDYLKLLTKLRELPNVKKVFVRSGIRYDYLIYDKNLTFFKELCKHHISGQLKVAPEHIDRKVLEKMGKPAPEVYFRFIDKYKEINKNLKMDQYLVPYLMSSHPGSDLSSAIVLAEYLRDIKHTPKQVQDFYPTPSTLSTAMYYTGVDPRTLKKISVPKKPKEKAMQRALMQYRLPQNYDLVLEALKIAKREDLIGFDNYCLIRPRKGKSFSPTKKIVDKQAYKKKKTIRNVHKKGNH